MPHLQWAPHNLRRPAAALQRLPGSTDSSCTSQSRAHISRAAAAMLQHLPHPATPVLDPAADPAAGHHSKRAATAAAAPVPAPPASIVSYSPEAALQGAGTPLPPPHSGACLSTVAGGVVTGKPDNQL